jgi:hypothetical protein
MKMFILLCTAAFNYSKPLSLPGLMGGWEAR